MKCKQCGTENLEGSFVCKKCGKNFSEEYKTVNSLETQIVNENNSKQFEENIQTNNNEMNLENNTNNSFAVYCQCGQKLEQNWKFCPKCKSPITIEIKSTTNVEQSKNIKDGNAIIYVSIFVISIACSYFLQFSWFFLVAIITIITGKIKCPNNKAIKVLFWLTILFIILYVILIMWIILVCSNSISSCPG